MRWMGLAALLMVAIGSTGTAAGIRHLSDLNLGVAFCFLSVVGVVLKGWVTDSKKHPEAIVGELLEGRGEFLPAAAVPASPPPEAAP